MRTSYAIFAYLLLAIWFDGARTFKLVFSTVKNETFMLPKPSRDQFSIAPEIWGFGQSFIFASTNQISNSSSDTEIKIQVGEKLSAEKIQCSIKCVSEANVVNTVVHSFRRAAYYNVLLTIHDEFENGERLIKFILIDLRTCTDVTLYRKPLPENYFIFSDYNFYKNAWKLTVLTPGNASWCDQAWCRHTYDSLYVDFKYFDIDFPLSDLHIEPASTYYNENLMVVRGFDSHDTYKVSSYYMTNKFSKYKELLALPSSRGMQIMASNLAFCWCYPGKDKTVICSKFRKDGRLVFNKTLSYDEPISIVYVKDIYKGLLLLTRKSQCQGNDCWTMSVSTILNDYESTEVSSSSFKFECSGDPSQLIFTVAEETLYSQQRVIRKIISRYVCDNGQEFNFNTSSSGPQDLRIAGKADQLGKHKKYHFT